MIEFPSTTVVNRLLPKDKFIEHLDLSPNLKKKLVSDIVHIRVLNKFSKSVLNFREELYEVECSKSPHQLPTTNHAEASASAITEVLLLQIELKKHDFDSKLIETIAKQNSHKLVFLLRFDKYSKLAVYYKQLYIGKWKPFEEVSLTLNGNNMNEVWLSFVEQIALEERREIRDERKEDCLEHRDSPSKNRCYVENNDVASCPKASPGGEVDCQRQDGVVSESVVNQTSLEQPSSQEVSKMPPFVKGDSCDSNRGIFNKNEEIETSDELKTSLSAKADSSPQVEPLGHHEAALSQYSKVISKSDLDHKLDLQNKAKALEKEIAKLDTAIRKERQPNRKFELHKKMMELEQSLNKLKTER